MAECQHQVPRTANHVELLAPAGGPKPFAAALAAGANAIYCGMGSFNARRKAENFTDEAFEAACRMAHLAGARVYVTVNIVIKDAEMTEALETVRRCSTLGADAFIIQDWGLFFEVKRLMPEIETHVSTQANIHDARGTIWAERAGADRVTLSRELSIAEIAAIHAETAIELEVFTHGSICFSYSGICLLSSFCQQGRSANRGMCAQPCRLPYDLLDEDGRIISAPGRGRPLCPRDTCTTDLIADLVAAGASALKLEGRMKAPDYVFAVTDAYRRYLDDLEAGVETSAAERDRRARQLKRSFNRDFTHAYQDGRSGDEMMSYERSNNRGEVVGRVIAFHAQEPLTKGERARAAIKGPQGTAVIKLTAPVGTGDLIEVRDDADPDAYLTALARTDGNAGERFELAVPRPVTTSCRVRVIRSQAAIDRADEVLKREAPRKRAVCAHVRARLGKPLAITLACVDDPTFTATSTGFTVEAARTRPVTAEDLEEHVGRMGTTPFEMVECTVELDEGCGMGFSAVHRVRAHACELLEQAILTPFEERAARLRTADLTGATTAEANIAPEEPIASGALELCALAATVDAARAAREAGAARIYLTVDALDAACLDPAGAVAEGFIPVLDEVSRACDHDRLDRWVVEAAPVAVGTVSELALAAERGASAELRSCIPVHNLACATFLAGKGARAVWLSPELSLAEIERFGPASPLTLGICIYGKPRVMTSEHCILKVADACIDDCARCRLRQKKLVLRNIDDKLLPVRTDIHGRSRLYDAYPLDLTPQLASLAAAGVTRFLVDGTLLADDELAEQVARAARALERTHRGQVPASRQRGSSAGCLFTGVE